MIVLEAIIVVSIGIILAVCLRYAFYRLDMLKRLVVHNAIDCCDEDKKIRDRIASLERANLFDEDMPEEADFFLPVKYPPVMNSKIRRAVKEYSEGMEP